MTTRQNLSWFLILLPVFFCSAPNTINDDCDQIHVNADMIASTQWLNENLDSDSLLIIDARPSAEYQSNHIKNAVNIDWNSMTRIVNGVRFRLVESDSIRAMLCGVGYNRGDRVVLYGDPGNSANWGEEGFLFWALDFAGIENIKVLDGGMSYWISNNLPTESGVPVSMPQGTCSLIISFDSTRITTMNQLIDNLTTGNRKLLDARSPEEYAGAKDYGEPRRGHIPGALNYHWRTALDQTGRMRFPCAIDNELSSLGVARSDSLVTYCTGGVRSGFMYFILKYLGYPTIANYDGSFEEWSRVDSLPVE